MNKTNLTEKINVKMRKKGSPHVITITSDKDPHFSNIRIVKRATGEVRGSHFILTSDVQQWQGLYERDGFRQVKGEDND